MNKLKVYVMAVGLDEKDETRCYVELSTSTAKEGQLMYIPREQAQWYGAHLYQWVAIGVTHVTD